ncbi:MAG: prepilin-type N-terminal cleavage/methylation domain-containing protein [Planctomycetes bacterium]|nr:prepilin-type N-terminal cleavage/methylation domain-containing protein [Planctomycetota bacterium]
MGRRNGFTLIELLVVISILAFLIGFLTVTAWHLMNKARVDKTKVRIGILDKGIVEYLAKYKRLPDFDGEKPGCGSDSLRRALCTPQQVIRSYDKRTNEAKYELVKPILWEITMDFIQGRKVPTTNEKASFVDSWDFSIDYRKGTDHSKTGGMDLSQAYDLESAGPDSKWQEDSADKDDDIKNWTRDMQNLFKENKKDEKK